MASYRHRIAEGAVKDLGAVKDFPAIKRDYDGYRLMLDARALAGGCMYGERVDGGGASCAGDKYLDRYDDPVMRRLSALMLGIYEPFCALSPEERRVLALRYWRKLEVPDVAAEPGRRGGTYVQQQHGLPAYQPRPREAVQAGS